MITIKGYMTELPTNLTLWLWSKISNSLFLKQFGRWLWFSLRFSEDARLGVWTKRLMEINRLVWKRWIWTLWVFGKIWLLIFVKFVLVEISSEVNVGKMKLLCNIPLFQPISIGVKKTVNLFYRRLIRSIIDGGHKSIIFLSQSIQSIHQFISVR